MNEVLRVAVVGSGRMGRHHARIYSELEGCDLVAVVDKDIERAREVANEYGAKAFADVADVTADLDAAAPEAGI